MRILSIFIINLLGFPICLAISIINKNLLHDGKPPLPIKPSNNIDESDPGFYH